MLNFILGKLLEYYPQITGYGLLAIVVAFITVKLVVFYMKTNTMHTSVNTLGTSLSNLEVTLLKIHTGLTTLNQVLLEREIIKQSCYSSTNSPRAISDLGLKLLKESGGEELLKRLQPLLLVDLEQKSFASLLDLERQSLNTLLERSTAPEFKGVQNFVFENPNFEGNPLAYSDLLFVMSLKLRDAYRAAHPERSAELSDYIIPDAN